jgi:purine-binding chemotaxis protein CheW
LDSTATVPESIGERVLVVLVGGARFAFRLGSVREILPFPTVVPLPGAPSFVMGMTNLRGRIVPVIDGAMRWGRTAATSSGTLLVLAFDDRWVGVHVDDVDRVESADTTHLRAWRDEVAEIPDREDGPLWLVDVAILLKLVLRDRGAKNP